VQASRQDAAAARRRGGWLKQPLSKRLANAIGTVVTIVYSALAFTFVMLPEARQSLRLLWEILI
jgi:hypothetical protein